MTDVAPSPIDTIGLDADDTLWEHEHFFRLTQNQFIDLLADYADTQHLGERLFAAETRNLAHYGFGVKGFTLSMIETAIEVTEGKVPAHLIERILVAGRDMLSHPIDPLPGVADTLDALKGNYGLVLITKGDLFDQERKLAQSGLGDLFDAIEIVSDKTAAIYQGAFQRHGSGPASAMMVGNSLKSDVLPALAAGAWGTHVPHRLTWAHEIAEDPDDKTRFARIDSLGQLPALLDDRR